MWYPRIFVVEDAQYSLSRSLQTNQGEWGWEGPTPLKAEYVMHTSRMFLPHWLELGHVATPSSKGGWKMDIGRWLGVLATERAGMWHLPLVTYHTADEAVSTTSLVVGLGSKG